MGLGSILGTGVFVSIGIAAGLAGPSVIVALGIAGTLAACNGLSSAQLAANHPVSGGTYEYGHRYLSPGLGFAAGWMFLCAKTASAATAALGFSGYLLRLLGMETVPRQVPAVVIVAAMTLLTAGGITRSDAVNRGIVAVTVGALLAFVGIGLPHTIGQGLAGYTPFLNDGGAGAIPNLLEASALLFVAYTGYGRIATLGEEVVEPRKTIPRAIHVTLAITALLYVSVAVTALGALPPAALAQATRDTAAPLEAAALALGAPGLDRLVAIGATTAMLGVMLNLVLGLSRVVLAMGRRGDLPRLFAGVRGGSPVPAVVGTGVAIGLLTLVGDVKTTWSFSAFTVLVYYALTNLAALRLSTSERLSPRWVAWAGLAGCLGLAPWVDLRVAAAGLGLLGAGFALRALLPR